MIATKLFTRGVEPFIGSVTNVLAGMGVTHPATGQPFSEGLLLGIGGGLGAGYILWEFKAHESAIIVMGFRNRWNYTTEYLTNLANRLNATLTIQETSGKKAAADNFNAALERGLPFLTAVDKAHMPHLHLPEALKGYSIHQVGVYGVEGNAVLVDDCGERLFAVPVDVFAAARARIPSDKNRLLLIDPPSSIDLPAAITAGINDHLEHLSRDSESFSLPVYKKWAKMLNDGKNKKGWGTVFKERVGLYTTLRSVFEGVTLDGTEGSGLRGMYADFLDDAAGVLNKPSLKDAAAAYRAAAAKWILFAESALPDAVPLFAETKQLMRARYAQTQAGQQEALVETMRQLAALEQAHKRTLPLSDAAITEQFAAMSAALMTIYDAEIAALEAVGMAMA